MGKCFKTERSCISFQLQWLICKIIKWTSQSVIYVAVWKATKNLNPGKNEKEKQNSI